MPDIARKSISASQTPALFDESPYTTRFMLYHWLRGRDVEQEEDNRMRAGSLMQPMLLDMARHDLNLVVESDQVFVRDGTLGSTKDAKIYDPQRGPGALETKACFDYKTWMTRWAGGSSPPRDIEIQLQTQMLVGDGDGTPYTWGVIGVWLAGDMRYYERPPHEELWAELRSRSAALIQDAEAGKEPDPFGAPIEIPLLNKLYPVLQRKTLDLSEEERGKEFAEKAMMYRAAAERRLAEEKTEKELKADLVALMADYDLLRLPNNISVELKRIPVKGRVQTVQAHVQNRVKVIGERSELDLDSILPQLD